MYFQIHKFFQGNLLLQDYSHKIHLSNGLIVDASVLGVASIDLSGKVIISLWYKNSHSVITNRYVDVFKQSLLYILPLSIISLYTCSIFLCVFLIDLLFSSTVGDWSSRAHYKLIQRNSDQEFDSPLNQRPISIFKLM